MAKKPLASLPVRRFALTPGSKPFFLALCIGLTFVMLLGLGLSQLSTVNAQTATPTLAFGDQTVGTTSAPLTSVFTNNSGSAMTVGVSLGNEPDFTMPHNGCAGVTLLPNDTCSVEVAFAPQSPGLKTGSLSYSPSFVNSGAGNQGARVNSEAQAVPAQAAPVTTLTGNGVAAPTVTPIPPTVTPIPPTATSVPPTATLIPPTATSVPPTATSIPPTATSVPPTTTTKAAPGCVSQIHGWVLVDGKPGEGQVLKLEGPSNNQLTIGPDGFFYFNNLCAGDYKVSLVYDHTKYTPVDPDTRTFKVDGINAYRDNQFSLQTIQATTAPATTAAPGTTAPVTTAPATSAPATTTAPAAPQCPANIVTPPADNRLRLGTQTVKVTDTSFLLCVQVAAGTSPVDLNDTVIINLPSGAVVSQANASLGSVTLNTNTVRWGGFSLAAQQSANLVLSINAPGGSLAGSSIFVSGQFNRSQAFQQRIPGLPGLTEILPPAQGGGTQGESGPAVIPAAAPATGVGPEGPQAASILIIVLGIIAAGSLGIVGLFLTARANKRPDNKEQK
jgi:hypothetical protein